MNLQEFIKVELHTQAVLVVVRGQLKNIQINTCMYRNKLRAKL